MRKEFERKYNIKRQPKHHKSRSISRNRSRRNESRSHKSRSRSRSPRGKERKFDKGDKEGNPGMVRGRTVRELILEKGGVTPVSKRKNSNRNGEGSVNDFTRDKSPSDTTIYAPGLTKNTKVVDNNNVNGIADFVERMRIDNEQRLSREGRESSSPGQQRRRSTTTSNIEVPDHRDNLPSTSSMDDALKQAEKLIVEAEQFKAAIEAPAGKNQVATPLLGTGQGMTDDDFFHIICHVDRKLRDKIEKGEFVDLEKLLPQGKYGRKSKDGATKLELVHREGETFYQPAEAPNQITNVRKWEQAFRIYAMIYCNANPEHTGEIWQYTYIINTAAATYVWENVAEYDYNFRQLMEFNPKRNWAVIYSQMWQLAMTEKLQKDFRFQGQHHRDFSEKKFSAQKISKDDEYCWGFQRSGKCRWGEKCRFVNRCKYCDSPKHGVNACPKIEKKKNSPVRAEVVQV